ncbi:MAG: hypothetical protein K2O34_07290, partial [Acetatifactor sp.]|nr:hypothetical protein [Acetatifactor sp.]
MEKKQTSQGDARRRRVQRLKKAIVLSVLVWMLLPVGLSIILFNRVDELNRQIADTQGCLQQMAEAMAQQEQAEAESETDSGVSRMEAIVTAPVAGAEGQDGSADVMALEPEAAHKVYLTFDDGPSKYTEEIL